MAINQVDTVIAVGAGCRRPAAAVGIALLLVAHRISCTLVWAVRATGTPHCGIISAQPGLAASLAQSI